MCMLQFIKMTRKIEKIINFHFGWDISSGDPNAYKLASDWIQTIDDPITGEKFNELILDEDWWKDRKNFSNYLGVVFFKLVLTV